MVQPKVRDVVPEGQPHRYGVSLVFPNTVSDGDPSRFVRGDGVIRMARVTDYYTGPLDEDRVLPTEHCHLFEQNQRRRGW